MRKKFILFTLLIFFVIAASASAKLPENILKGIEDNKIAAETALKNISFLVAFLAGILSILSPCTYAILPAFFSYTFKEKKEITKMTFLFFLGSATIFIGLGLLAAFLGETVASIQFNYPIIPYASGLFLIFFGGMTFFGKGFSSGFSEQKTNTDPLGIFLFGIFFALGWTACLGPIIASILLIATLLHSYLQAAILLFFYALGAFIPLFLLSYFYDKYKLGEKRWMKGKSISFKLFEKKIETHSTNVIAGILLILFGVIIFIFKGTNVFNDWDILQTKNYFYDLQRILEGSAVENIVGLILLIIVGYIIYKALKKKD